MRDHTIRWAWTIGAILLVWLAAARQGLPSPTGRSVRFQVAPLESNLDTNAAPLFAAEVIDPARTVPSVHVASLCELDGGRLLASWYGGTREGHPDVAVFTAIQEPGATSWSKPVVVVDREIAQRELDRFVKKVGNAVVFSDGRRQVWMLYVTIAAGGWSGSSLNLKVSHNGGQTWSRSERLVLSPWFNLSELGKNQPVPLVDGGWCVPIYHELVGKFPELLWLPPKGGAAAATKTRPFGGGMAFQPALVALDGERALLACRDVTERRRVFLSWSEDAGASWAAPAAADLPNPGSGLDALRLRDGRVLMAFNDSEQGRDVLRLAVSGDAGRSWHRTGTLEREPGQEFSYPFLLQTTDGRVHVVYTWKRQNIKHAAFNSAWLKAQCKRNDP